MNSKPDSIATWRCPVLFIHGDDDRNVPFQQTTDLVKKLRDQKVAFDELIIPDENHDLLIELSLKNWPFLPNLSDQTLALVTILSSVGIDSFLRMNLCFPQILLHGFQISLS
jgi:fermentation-respiration switch protein FrsA (DUF1100 family)